VDVVIRTEAEPTGQYGDTDRIRLVAEALNTRDALSVGHAFVDVPLPLDKPHINEYTLYIARKLMDDMTAAWIAPAPVRQGPAATTSGSVSPRINDLNSKPEPAVPLPELKKPEGGAVVVPSTKP
jgi:predicted XRE-type DNA-binding protein